ncbi:MAG: asparagine synthase (glutamine-hydrolyzing) [Hyphomicrobium sp.]
MCGLAGILHFGARPEAQSRVKAMADAMVHRGPDDEGFWSEGDCALGFRRLSIVDLEGGHQPMSNEDGTVWVVFNGEIYNHPELRHVLQAAGHRFASDHSDTEVLVHGWEEWGETLAERLNGMFAFAIWDQRQKALYMARDRYGIKPLYLAQNGGAMLFASEIRAIHASGLVEPEPDTTAVLEYFSHQNLWGSRTMFRGVELLPPATWQRIDRSGTKRRSYWDYRFERTSRLSLAEAAEAHRGILERVLKRQIAADVPVMSYLSGGIDSSAITAGAHRLDPGVRAYSCLFDLTGVGDDRIVDEREFSRAMAKHLSIEHIELELAPTTLADALAPTIAALEHPHMGMSYVNHCIAGRVAADSKVVLSGTGGDEMHGGYVYRYQGTSIGRQRPLLSLRGLRDRIRGRNVRTWNEAIAAFDGIVNFLAPDDRARQLFAPEFLRGAGSYVASDALRAVIDQCPSDNIWDRVLYTDAKTYLHGLLVMEDKLSMAHALEARVPLLDNELVDFVNRLPWSHLFDGETGKIIFRESVRPLVPDAIYRKPKMGFGPPDASWYRTALRPFIERTLAPRIIRQRGVFQPTCVAKALDDHFAARANNLPLIWSLLSFEAWCAYTGFFGGRLNEEAAGAARGLAAS